MAAGAMIGNLAVNLTMETAAFERGASIAEKRMGALQNRLGKVGQRMGQIGTIMTAAITLPMAGFAAKAVQVAQDAQEMNSAFDVVFGNMAGSVREWADATGDAMGRSTQEMQRGALAFQELFSKALDPQKSAAMSKTFAVLVQDLASFKNLSNEVAQQKLFSGLAGEAEPLRAVGVFLSEAKVQAAALELGLEKVNGKFTEEQKILARAKVIQDELANAQGDVVRTSESAANKAKEVRAAYEELSVEIGTRLLPLKVKLAEMAVKVLEAFQKLSPQAQNFALGAAALTAALGPAMMVFGPLLPVMTKLVPLFGAAGLAGSLSSLMAFLGPVSIAAGIAYVAWKNWDSIGPALTNWAPGFVERLGTLQDRLNDFNNRVNEADQRLGVPPKSVFFDAIDADMKDTSFNQKKWAAETWAAVQKLDRDIAQGARNIWQSFETNWDKATAATARMVAQIRAELVGKLDSIVESVKGKLRSVRDAFQRLGDKLVFNSIVPDMVDGIAAQMARLDAVMVQPVQDATGKAAAAFRDLQQRTAALLDRLFPEARAANQFAADTATLEAAGRAGEISIDQMRAALERLYGTLPKIDETKAAMESTASAADTAAAAFERMAEKSPFQQWAETVPRTAAQVSTALQSIAVRGFDGLANAIANVITGTRSLKDAFGSLARAIISDIIQMTMRMLIFRAISGMFGGAMGGAGAGNDIVVTGFPSGLPKMAGGGEGVFGGFGGVDRNLLSLNGSPIARVSKGENFSVSPANDAGRTRVVVELRDEMLAARIVEGAGMVVDMKTPGIVGQSVSTTFNAASRPALVGRR